MKGTVEQLPSGRWRARRKDPTTNRYVALGTFATEQEATIALSRPVPKRGGLTLADYGEGFLKRRRDRVLDWSNDEGRWRLYVDTSELAAVPLAKLTRGHIKRWLDWLRKDLKLGLQTQKNALSLVRVALEDVLDDEIIEANPARNIRVKKVDADSNAEAWDILYPDEQIALLNAVPVEEWHTVAFALGQGSRNSEQWQLRLEDVDLEKREAILRRTKNKKARVVSLFGVGLDAAKEAVERQKKKCPYAFPSPRTNERRWLDSHPGGWATWLERAGIKRRVRWYDLRHTCATSLLAGWWGRKWTLDEVSKLLGHSSIKVTERYAHKLDETLKRAAEGTGFHAELSNSRNSRADLGIRTPDLRFTNPRNIEGFSGLAAEQFHRRSTAESAEQAANLLEATRLAYRMGGDPLARARVRSILETEMRRFA